MARSLHIEGSGKTYNVEIDLNLTENHISLILCLIKSKIPILFPLKSVFF